MKERPICFSFVHLLLTRPCTVWYKDVGLRALANLHFGQTSQTCTWDTQKKKNEWIMVKSYNSNCIEDMWLKVPLIWCLISFIILLLGSHENVYLQIDLSSIRINKWSPYPPLLLLTTSSSFTEVNTYIICYYFEGSYYFEFLFGRALGLRYCRQY